MTLPPTLAVSLMGPIGPDFTIDLAFEIPAAGITALLGPSGSGKSTVLRALAGLTRVAGSIRIGDEVWQAPGSFVPPHRRHVGYVFQGAGLLPHLTVAQNLDYAARRALPGPFERTDTIARTGIGALLDRYPARLSGGEAQRASIARALLSQPSLLLLDEPLSALDSEAREHLLGHLETMLAALTIPVIYVTHDEREAERLAARTLRLRDGQLERALAQ